MPIETSEEDFVDLPTAVERKEIFAVHLQKRKRGLAAFDLDRLAAAAEGFTGAEIERAVVSGLYTAFSRSVELTTDILLELRATRPLSVTRKEAIDALRAWAREHAVMAN
ncbi:MAG: hypothetical protein DME14_03385 [Candidatus Rokuibacteriota bacterium]|nr:MAG: hypothetical protein DME14_03385 [Candidatus Rokubacteria bacterium]